MHLFVKNWILKALLSSAVWGTKTESVNSGNRNMKSEQFQSISV